jgi:hypothetical protein
MYLDKLSLYTPKKGIIMKMEIIVDQTQKVNVLETVRE